MKSELRFSNFPGKTRKSSIKEIFAKVSKSRTRLGKARQTLGKLLPNSPDENHFNDQAEKMYKAIEIGSV